MDGSPASATRYVQGLLLDLEGGTTILLDKGPWFGEIIDVSMGATSDLQPYDDSTSWEDDEDCPEEHWGYESQTVPLATSQ